MKSYYLYSRHISRVWPLPITSPAAILVQTTTFSCLDYCLVPQQSIVYKAEEPLKMLFRLSQFSDQVLQWFPIFLLVKATVLIGAQRAQKIWAPISTLLSFLSSLHYCSFCSFCSMHMLFLKYYWQALPSGPLNLPFPLPGALFIRYPRCSLPHLLQIFAQMSPSPWSLPWLPNFNS